MKYYTTNLGVIEMTEATQVRELSAKDILIEKIKEITQCTDEQSNDVFVAIDSLFVTRLQEMFTDPKVLQDIYLNMQAIQLQNVGKYRELEPQLTQAEIFILDEENEYTNLRVIYTTANQDEWLFEQRLDGVWTLLPVEGKERLSLVANAGKFFDGRVDRTGYFIDSVSLEKLAQH